MQEKVEEENVWEKKIVAKLQEEDKASWRKRGKVN